MTFIKNFCNYCIGKQQPPQKTSFCLKKKTSSKNLFVIYIYLTRNDLIIKLFHILRLTALDIYLSLVAPISLFALIFDAFQDSTCYLNGV